MRPDGAVEDDSERLIDPDGELIEPDLIRVANRKRLRDEEGNFVAMGLLAEIGKDDLLDTDLYVFRTSTGELVTEKTPFAHGEGNALNGIDDAESSGFFELAIPGRDADTRSVQHDSARRAASYEDWQASSGVPESMRGGGVALCALAKPFR